MTSNSIGPATSLILVLIMAGIGIRLVADSRRSRQTGVAHTFFQWPNDFDQQTQPVQFWLSVSITGVVGYGLLLGAIVSVVGILLRMTR
jgi:hypothetical protein